MKLSENIRLFRRTSAIEGEIDRFLDLTSEAGLIFKQAVHVFLKHGPCTLFEDKLTQINNIESSADKLRRSIETQLYTQTLIPESRGDVLGLLENLDNITNLIEGTLWGFSIETPTITEEYKENFSYLIDFVADSVESLTQSSRAFFRDTEAVGNHNHKVMFFEKEADKISTKLKQEIFASDAPLAQKMHLRDFVEKIDSVADLAEDVADRLTIYVIKRTI